MHLFSGYFLFQVSSVGAGSVLMIGLGDDGARSNQGYAIGLMPANDGQSGNPAVGTKGATITAMTAGASLSANTTYLYSFSYAGGTTTAWILTPDQYNTFSTVSGLDRDAMNMTAIGTGPTDVVGRASSSRTGDLPSRITELYAYFFSGGTMLVDQISVTGIPVIEATIGFDCSSGTIGNYYNGGAGPNLGIGFAAGSASNGQLSTDPGPVINVPGGFSTGFAVSYSLSVGFRINVYDGLDGTGNLLATLVTSSTLLTCRQTTVQLTANMPGTTSFQFAGPGLSQLGSGNRATVTQAGVYSVTATGGGCSGTASTTVSSSIGTPPNALLLGSGNLSCSTPTLSLTAIGGSSYSFSGLLGGPTGIVSQDDGRQQIIEGDYIINARRIPTFGIIVVNKPGTYQVLVTDENGCSATASIIVTGQECR